jgi:hypothetical protein
MWLKVKVAEVGFIKYAPKHMILSHSERWILTMFSMATKTVLFGLDYRTWLRAPARAEQRRNSRVLLKVLSKRGPKWPALRRPLLEGLMGTAEHLHPDNDGVADWIKSPQERARVFVEQHAEEAVQESKTALNNGKGTK